MDGDIHRQCVEGDDEYGSVVATLDQVHATALADLRAAIAERKHFVLIVGDVVEREGTLAISCHLTAGGVSEARRAVAEQLAGGFLEAARVTIETAIERSTDG